METSRPGPTNSIILRAKEALAGMATLSVTADGQNGAVAVVGSLNFTGTKRAAGRGVDVKVLRHILIRKISPSRDQQDPYISELARETLFQIGTRLRWSEACPRVGSPVSTCGDWSDAFAGKPRSNG